MKYVVIGGNVAGTTAARDLLKLDPQAEIAVYTNEAYPYYYRPRLWEYLAGRVEAEETYFRPFEWYQEQGIDLHLNTCVEKLDAGRKELYLDSGETVSYDRLLIAAGGRSFVPPVKGTELENVFAFRNLDDAKAIVACAETAKEVVLIGGGLLGLETAKALTDRGLHVTVVEFFPILLPRQLDAPGAEVLTTHLEQFGMTLLTDQITETIEKQGDHLLVSLKSGKKLEADMVVFSTGIRSNIAVWQEAGVEANRGLVVNEFMETNLPDVFAAGDVAEFGGLVYGIIPAARDQAKFAAANMANDHSQAYEGTLLSTKLKVAGMEFNALGDSTVDGDDVEILRLSLPDEERYERIAIRDNKVIGAIVLGNAAHFRGLKNLIANQTDVSAVKEHLLEDDFDYKSLK